MATAGGTRTDPRQIEERRHSWHRYTGLAHGGQRPLTSMHPGWYVPTPHSQQGVGGSPQQRQSG